MVYSQNEKDTAFISQFEKPNNIQLNTWVTDLDFSINPRLQDRDFTVKFAPNVSGQTGFSFGLKKVTLFIGFQIPGTESDPWKYGKTKYLDFSFSYFNKKFGGEIYYRNYNGLYRDANDTTPLTIRDDARLTNYGGSFFYVFNYKKFSYRSAIGQLELQKKSAGSVVILANVNFRSLVADSSLIPKEIDSRQNFSNLQGLTDLRFYTFNIRPGYAYNFVFKKGMYFISPSIFAGAGIGNFEYRGISGTVERGVNYDMDLRSIISAGMNHKNWFINIFVIYDTSLNIFDNNLVSLQTTSYGLNIGYRLKSYFRIKWL